MAQLAFHPSELPFDFCLDWDLSVCDKFLQHPVTIVFTQVSLI